MFNNIELRFEVDETKYSYVFGTHLKNTKNREFVNLNLSETEILNIKKELFIVLDKLIEKSL